MHSSHAVRQVMGSYPAIAPYLEKYKLGVHQFAPPSEAASLERLSQHLPILIPPELRSFYAKGNGAILFHGSLILRSVAELAPVCTTQMSIIGFADEHYTGRQWCFAQDNDQFVLGLWANGEFTPRYAHFDEWLLGTLAVFDAHVQNSDAELHLRQSLHPDNPYLKLPAVDALLKQGQVEAASTLSRDLVDAIPWPRTAFLHGALQFALGLDTAIDYFLRGLQNLSLPSGNPAQLPDLETLYPIAALLSNNAESLLPLLRKHCFETLEEIKNQSDILVLDELLLFVVGHSVAVGDRRKAIDELEVYLKHRPKGLCLDSVERLRLKLGQIYYEHGLHDAAEKELRSQRDPNSHYHWEAELLIGRIAAIRKERWAIEILKNVADNATTTEHRLQAWVWIGHAYIQRDLINEATTVFQYCLQENGLQDDIYLTGYVELGLAMCEPESLSVAVPKAESLHPLHQIHRLMFLSQKDTGNGQVYLKEALEIARKQQLKYEETQILIALIPFSPSAEQAAVECAKNVKDPSGWMRASSNASAQIESHIDTVQSYMRLRFRAQRSQFPLKRRDSEHPERRIHQYRIALSKGSKSVVDALAHQLLVIEKDLQEGPVLPSNPKLHRYMAAVDLLCYHPSLHAADSLLRMLIDERATGLVRQALIQAVSRSRNMALVEGLVDVLRSDNGGRHLLAVTEILGWRRENAAVTTLRQRLTDSFSITSRRSTLLALGRIGNDSVIDDIVRCLGTPELLEACALSLLLLGDWRGLDALAQALHESPESVPYTFGELVGRYGGRNYFLLLSQVAKGDTPAAVGAILGLGYVGDLRAVPILLEQCSHSDPRRTQAASQALEVLTGHFEKSDDIMLRTRWEEWWFKNGGKMNNLGLVRNGKPYSLDLLVDDLGHDSPRVRQNSYDELVIATGCTLPFDGHGPWRTQIKQRRSWGKWLKSNEFAAGQKYFWSEVLL